MSTKTDTRYAFPPVVEAVLEIRPTAPLSELKIAKISAQVGKGYPNNVKQTPVSVDVDFVSRAAKFRDGPPTYIHTSGDASDQFTAASGSISWVRRAPYEGWESFSGRIKSEFPHVMKLSGRPALSRVGLRYVNRIDVPEVDGICNYEDYLNFHLRHGEITDPSNGYEWKVVRNFPETGISIALQSAVVAPEIPGTGAFTFDIDVFTTQDVPTDDARFFEMLETLRKLKNSIFEEGISEKARELYR